jgi:hypothetical protein
VYAQIGRPIAASHVCAAHGRARFPGSQPSHQKSHEERAILWV